MSYEIPAIAGISAGYIVSYFIGARKKGKLIANYAKAIEETLKDIGHVGFRPFGHAGVRIRCTVEKQEHDLKSLEIAIALAGRENLLYYPLWFLWPERDTFTCWASPRTPVHYALEVLPASSTKEVKELENNETMKSLYVRGLGLPESYRVFTNARNVAGRFLSDFEIRTSLNNLGKSVRRFALDANHSRIYLSANIGEKTLPTLVSLMLGAGKVFNRTVA